MSRALAFAARTDEVQTIAALRALGAPVSASAIVYASGYYAAGDMGGGEFRWDADEDRDDNNGTIIKPTGITAENPGRWLRMLPDGLFNVRHFGAKPNDVSFGDENSDAFDDAIEAMGGPLGVSEASYSSAKLIVPPEYTRGRIAIATYTMGRALVLKRSIDISGPHAVGFFGCARLMFPLGTEGITCPYVLDDPIGPRGDFSYIHDLEIGSTYFGDNTYGQQFWAPATTYEVGDMRTPTVTHENLRGMALRCTVGGESGATLADEPDFTTEAETYDDNEVTWEAVYAHGVNVRCSFVRIERCYIHNFPGNGVHVYGNTPSSGSNNCKFVDNFVRGNGGCGMWFAGGDVNVEMWSGNDTSFNSGWGLRSEQSISSPALAHHCDMNWRGNYHGIQGFECYTEGGGAMQIAHSLKWRGGSTPDGFSHEWVKPWEAGESIVQGDKRSPTVPDGFSYYAVCTGTQTTGVSEPTWPPIPGRLRIAEDGAIDWYAWGPYDGPGSSAPQMFIDQNAAIASARTFVDPTQETLQGFHACFPTNAHAVWGWFKGDDQFTIQADNFFAAHHAFVWGNAPASSDYPNHPILFTDQYDDGTIFPDGIGPGRLCIPWPFFIGEPHGEARIRMGVDTVPPSDGSSRWKAEYWRQGSIMWNRNAAAGGKAGWICVTSGGVGVHAWKPWGEIDA